MRSRLGIGLGKPRTEVKGGVKTDCADPGTNPGSFNNSHYFQASVFRSHSQEWYPRILIIYINGIWSKVSRVIISHQNNVTCWENDPLQCRHIQISWKDFERVEIMPYVERQPISFMRLSHRTEIHLYFLTELLVFLSKWSVFYLSLLAIKVNSSVNSEIQRKFP